MDLNLALASVTSAVIAAVIASLLVPMAIRLAEVLDAMETAGTDLRTVTADFEQVDHDYILKDERSRTGRLHVGLPGRIRWEYAPPAVTSWVS